MSNLKIFTFDIKNREKESDSYEHNYGLNKEFNGRIGGVFCCE